MITTACPLDCYDACGISCDPSNPTRFKATTTHPTSNGALCPLLNKYMFETPRIQKPRVGGVEVSMEEALDAVAAALKDSNPLFWIGSGHLGLMQSVTNLLIERLNGTKTYGNLCDGAGGAGILAGRAYNRQLPPEQIAKAEVIVAWGRNVTTTTSHIMPYIEDKKLIVIDPVRTPIAKKAHMHLQLRPRSDFQLAILLARMAFMECLEDEEWLRSHSDDYEDFYEFTQGFRMMEFARQTDVELTQIDAMLEMIAGKRVVFLVGGGVQKYSIGHFVIWAIDSLAATLGLFGREGCGVSYLGESRQGLEKLFSVDLPKVSIVTTPFEEFQTVLVQGGNPAGSMPDSNRVQRSLKQVKNLIYFGLHENETSSLAHIIIPAKNFLEKEDIRTSYGHHYITDMHQALQSDIGISEYEFVQEMFVRLGLDGLKEESEYLHMWREQYRYKDNYPVLPDYEALPYANGFGEENNKSFVFMDEFEDEFEEYALIDDGKYWLLSPKDTKSLNTQFVRDNKIVLHRSAGFDDAERIRVCSEYGSGEYIVEISDDIRDDCVVIRSNAIGVNRLTPSIASIEGEGACYQEVKVTLERV